MSKKRKRNHKTTKNTVAKPPVRRFAVIRVICNGEQDIVTDIPEAEFMKLSEEWFDHPETTLWTVQKMLEYINMKIPDKVCIMKEDFDRITKGNMIPATREEWLAEQN